MRRDSDLKLKNLKNSETEGAENSENTVRFVGALELDLGNSHGVAVPCTSRSQGRKSTQQIRFMPGCLPGKANAAKSSCLSLGAGFMIGDVAGRSTS
jgi:hypothetical protein